MLVDLRPFDANLTGKAAQEALDRSGITLNKNTLPGHTRSPFVRSGLGLPPVRRGAEPIAGSVLTRSSPVGAERA
jgi:glycine/serine hydroxymethyltransferase